MLCFVIHYVYGMDRPTKRSYRNDEVPDLQPIETDREWEIIEAIIDGLQTAANSDDEENEVDSLTIMIEE